jgi:methyl-accepting chemotaxis protein
MRWSLTIRIALLPLIVAVLYVGSVGWGWVQSGIANQVLQNAADVLAPAALALQRADSTYAVQRQAYTDAFTLGDQGPLDNAITSGEQVLKLLSGVAKDTRVNAELAASAQKLHDDIAAFQTEADAFYRPLVTQFDLTDEQQKAIQAMGKRGENLGLEMETLRRDGANRLTQVLNQIAKDGDRRRLVEVLTVIVAIAVAVALTAWLASSIRSDLATVGRRVQGTTENLGTASNQVSQASVTLEDNSQEQSRGVSSAMSSLRALLTRAEANVRMTENAQRSLEELMVRLKHGREALEQLQHAMNAISRGSAETSTLMSTIRDIAFQTTLLSVNAAIEASRGDSGGQGFQVVAGQVRSLATRSTSETRKTSQLVTQAQAQTIAGVRGTEELEAIYGEIRRAADQVREVLVHLAEDSARQKSSVEEIGERMAVIERIADANRRDAERAGVTSTTLGDQVAEMQAVATSLSLLIHGSDRDDSPI